MTKQSKLIAALTTAARRQTDPIKRAKIADKIKQIKDRKTMADWLGN
jgi:hypothetical protein